MARPDTDAVVNDPSLEPGPMTRARLVWVAMVMTICIVCMEAGPIAWVNYLGKDAVETWAPLIFYVTLIIFSHHLCFIYVIVSKDCRKDYARNANLKSRMRYLVGILIITLILSISVWGYLIYQATERSQ